MATKQFLHLPFVIPSTGSGRRLSASEESLSLAKRDSSLRFAQGQACFAPQNDSLTKLLNCHSLVKFLRWGN